MSLGLDVEKNRRETLRWLIVLTLNAARPLGAGEVLIISAVCEAIPDVTPRELRNEMNYLAERQLIHLVHENRPQWFATLTRVGIDIAEYTIPCEPGIARPAKYWPD